MLMSFAKKSTMLAGSVLAAILIQCPAEVAAGGNNFAAKTIQKTRQDGLGMMFEKAKKKLRRNSIQIEPAAASAEPPEEIPSDLADTSADPLERVNRVFFAINEGIDRVILEPVAQVYHVIVPKPVRRGVSNVLANARMPITLANDILQGNRDRAGQTMVRFMVNSTVGLGGLMDFASDAGVQPHTEDFGQTLAIWGVGSGPYMVVPVLGPSNPRDFAGRIVDTAFNPTTWILADEPIEIRLAPGGAEIISGREAVLEDARKLRESSPDFYVTVRDIYGQQRQSEISNGSFAGGPIPDVTGIPDVNGMPSVQAIVTPH
jgi:phospholipid-binding lipoprotein MlaA